MSDLSLPVEALQRSRSQLPVFAYFDANVFARERNLILDQSARYVGHELSVPEIGDHHVLEHEDGGRALVRTESGVELISNVCRHRQAAMLRGRGNTGSNIVCPLHRWTYDLRGRLMGAPHFRDDPCLNLQNYPVQRWNGLIFENKGRDVAADLEKLDQRAEFDFRGYVLDRVHTHECAYNWKTCIEVYLEDYHVSPFHPGLGGFVALDELRWEMGEQYSVQTVGFAKHIAADAESAGSPVYQQWQDAVMRYQQGRQPAHGAIWLTYYPTVMIERYPNALVISALYPKGPQHTTNIVEFYYPEDIAAFEREYVQAQQAAYLETCAEDDEIALRMDQGRKALYLRGDDEVGPYQSPMEDGMQQFHEWYRRTLGFACGAAQSHGP